ncbi:MAG: presenilin family intramembrane aspartyl protease [Nanoarchaeota archaeon]
MKHTASITFFLLAIFLITQITGLTLLRFYGIGDISMKDGVVTIDHSQTVEDFSPQTSGVGSFIYLVSAILIGTVLVLAIIRFNKPMVWKWWFFLAVAISIGVVFSAVLGVYWLAFIIGGVLAFLKLRWPNVLIHNFTEILMYSGIMLLLAPRLDLFWAIMLLLVVSAYDMFAVWKSKHMVKMAVFQTKSKMFAGLMIPYGGAAGPARESKDVPASQMLSKKGHKNAILGGGDVAFPLIFSGVLMEHLILTGVEPNLALAKSLIVSVMVTVSLLALFLFAKKDRFYPAMPIVTAGCLVGAVIALL